MYRERKPKKSERHPGQNKVTFFPDSEDRTLHFKISDAIERAKWKV